MMQKQIVFLYATYEVIKSRQVRKKNNVLVGDFSNTILFYFQSEKPNVCQQQFRLRNRFRWIIDGYLIG